MVGESAEIILKLFFKAFCFQKIILRTYLRGHFGVEIDFWRNIFLSQDFLSATSFYIRFVGAYPAHIAIQG